MIGPLARSADDLEQVLDAIAGPDEIEAAGYRLELPEPRVRDLRGLRVAVMLDCELSETDREYRDILRNLVDRIAAAGAIVNDAARVRVRTHRYRTAGEGGLLRSCTPTVQAAVVTDDGHGIDMF